jgi:Type II secretory pathway, pseudopilin PulG
MNTHTHILPPRSPSVFFVVKKCFVSSCLRARKKSSISSVFSVVKKIRAIHAIRGQFPSLSAFTVVELLLVISVLSVVLAITLPSGKIIRDTALRRQAQVEATALTQAAIRYKTEYGFWPGQLQPNNDAQGTVKLRNDIPRRDEMLSLIAYGPSAFLDGLEFRDANGTLAADPNVLRLYDDNAQGHAPYQSFCTVGQAASAPYPINPLNPKRISFLTLQNEHAYEHVDYRDPWGQSYVLFMGLHPQSLFRFQVKNSEGAVIRTQTVSNQIAFAYSIGPPTHRGTNHIYSAGVIP